MLRDRKMETTPLSVPTSPSRDVAGLLSEPMFPRIFPEKLKLIPQLNELYELEIAYYESRILTDNEIIRNGAYFSQVGDTFTRHFLMCTGEPVRLPQHSSSRLRSFFKKNQFRTGYATHGLFPYRGKFHPQMIKGLLNVMGLKAGETVLDPMMGSGTVLIEASLLGIKSVGVDASPFCQFMTQAKLNGLTIPLEPVRLAVRQSELTFDYFSKLVGSPEQGVKAKRTPNRDLFSVAEPTMSIEARVGKDGLPDGCNQQEVYDFLLLAYLDSAGYSERSDRKSPYEQFKAILERYLFVAEKIQAVLAGSEAELADAKTCEGDARSLQLENNSVDGILFSPPYSFAIDYLDNDSFHLAYLGADLEDLRARMVGLRGKSLADKFAAYKLDMESVLSECSRVLRPHRFCTIVVGTNNNQLSKVFGVAPEEVEGIDDLLVEMGATYGLRLLRKLERQITGMANTMRTEFILLLQRTSS